jgi:hypothetical protein
MNILLILKIVAAVLTAATGLLALAKPTAVFSFTGLTAAGTRGVSEIRAIFGGLFLALGVAPFLFGAAAYLVLGIGYLGIAAARLASIFFDRSSDSSNLISLAIEVVCGVVLFLG